MNILLFYRKQDRKSKGKREREREELCLDFPVALTVFAFNFLFFFSFIDRRMENDHYLMKIRSKKKKTWKRREIDEQFSTYQLCRILFV